MAQAVLMGAGIGAGTSLLTGRDPLKGALIGGAVGGGGAYLSGAGAAGAGAGAAEATAGQVVSQGPIHLGEAATTQAITPGILNSPVPEVATSSGLLGNLGSGMDKLNELTGMEKKDWTMLGLSNMDKLTPEQQQQIQHANLPPIAGNPTAIEGQVNSIGPIDQQVSAGTQTQGISPEEELERRYMYQNPAWRTRIGG